MVQSLWLIDVSSTSNPTPLPRGDLPDVNFGSIDIIDDFDNPKPGTSGLSRMRTLAQTKWSDSETTDVDVGQELEDAIARFENNGRTEVKKEANIDHKPSEPNDGHNSDSSCSSVLIVGYVKPLHERTPEFVDLISSEDEKVDQNESERHTKRKKSKKEKKDKHRKRSSGRSHSHSSSDSHSKHKRKCKHRSRDRNKHKNSDRHHRHRHRHSRHSSTSSSTSGSSYDELRQLHKSFNKREDEWRKWCPESKYSYHRSEIPVLNSPVAEKRSVTVTSSSSRPPSLSSVVIRKEAPNNQSFKYRPYLIYSDSD